MEKWWGEERRIRNENEIKKNYVIMERRENEEGVGLERRKKKTKKNVGNFI